MSAVDDVARMLTLVPWLLERPGASVAEAAEAFGVDPRRIRDDLYHLDFCGLPGLGGGDLFEVTIVGDRVVVQMADELKRPLRLTPPEALRLMLTVGSVASAFGEDLPALRSALEKIREAAGLPEGVVDQAGFEGGRWLGEARRAIREGRQVRLRYRGRADDAPQPRTIDPWGLHLADGAWYLQGHDRDADGLRTFRLDRAVALEVLEAPIAHPRPEDELPPPRYVAAPGDPTVLLELEPAGRWLLDAVQPDATEELPDGRVRVRFSTDVPAWVEQLVLVGGGDATVVGPLELRRNVVGTAEAALRRYRT